MNEAEARAANVERRLHLCKEVALTTAMAREHVYRAKRKELRFSFYRLRNCWSMMKEIIEMNELCIAFENSLLAHGEPIMLPADSITLLETAVAKTIFRR